MSRLRLVGLVGGLYVRAVLRGLCEGTPAHPDLRRLLEAREAEAPGTLARWAHRLDPAAASRIHPHDAVRLVRALEVALTTGRRLSERQRAHAFADAPYDVLLIGLAVPTPVLDARIAARVQAMVDAGWVEEAAGLEARLPADAPAWRTLGYPEMRAVARGRLDLAPAITATVAATRRFAKRQRTWFRREAGLVWRDPTADRARILDEAAAFLVAKPRDAG
jgi:tRNA dimethylallyltransferase